MSEETQWRFAGPVEVGAGKQARARVTVRIGAVAGRGARGQPSANPFVAASSITSFFSSPASCRSSSSLARSASCWRPDTSIGSSSSPLFRRWRPGPAHAARSTCGGTQTSTPTWRAPRCADPARRGAPAPGAGDRRVAVDRLGGGARHSGQLAGRGASRADHRDLHPALHDGPQAPDAAKHRDRRRGRGVAADDRMGRGGEACRSGRSRSFSSSSSGRRRTSGRWRSAATAITSGSACRCCPMWSVPSRPAGRS